AEHARVLGVLREIRDLLAQGDVTWLAQLIREIPEWFLTHAAGMDSALVLFLNERGFDFDREQLPAGAQPFPCGPTACTTAGGC
ncbi:MAG: cation-binding hemerythrin HHE, partial [Rhodocyclaceae bacterium]|nr:cation-binding hemerythrin HHE [Rhodocyclaceae bacterium]